MQAAPALHCGWLDELLKLLEDELDDGVGVLVGVGVGLGVTGQAGPV